jgi:hypothetical protein
LYFAGNQSVARSYRDKLSPDRDVWINGLPSEEYLRSLGKSGSTERMAVSALQEHAPEALDVDDLFNYARGYLADPGPAWQKTLNDLRQKNVTLGRQPGRMYEVEIAHPENSLLDWDRPLKSQGDVVRELLLPFRNDKYDLSIGDGTDYETGATAVHRIAGAFDDDMAEAADALRKAGIPGIRYLDRGSRARADGTRNYVMFPGTEDSIRILRKYGMMAPIAAGASAGEGAE